MSQNRIPRWALVGIAVIVLLGLGSAVHSAGWSQGYTMGLLAGSADGASVLPYLISRTGSGLQVGGFGGFFGTIFRVGFILLLIAMVAKFFGFRRWHMHGPRGPWRHHHGWPEPEPNDRPADDSAPPVQTKSEEPTLTHV